MAILLSRRELLLGLGGLPLSKLPLQDVEVLPWADAGPLPSRVEGARYTDLSRLESRIVPVGTFFVLHHHGVPRIDARVHALALRGGSEPERRLSLEALRALPGRELEVCFECAGNGGVGMHGLVGNARFRGVPLRDLLSDGRIGSRAKEIVFYGADEAEERLRRNRYPARFARSLSIAVALDGDALVAYEMNGEPLAPEHGFPLRLVVPGWYGVAQVKWLREIEVLDRRFMGWYMAKEYVTLRGYERDGLIEHRATSVGPQRLKSLVTRVTRRRGAGSRLTIEGRVWNDGSPLHGVEVRIDGAPFRRARLEARASPYAWTSFELDWDDARPGRHRLVSRARDAAGVQPTEAEASRTKATPWENDGQVVREVTVPP